MSLNIEDLGLTEDMRSLVIDLASSQIHFTQLYTPESNPFKPSVSQPELLFSADAILVKPMTAEATRQIFGATDHLFYKCAIATPIQPFFSMLRVGCYAFLNFSESTKVVGGVVKRLDYQLSSLIYVYLDSSESVPFSPLDIGVVV